MANWTDIPDAVLEIGQPIRSIDAKALRDNPIAIARGASGAPKIDGADNPVIETNAITNRNLIGLHAARATDPSIPALTVSASNDFALGGAADLVVGTTTNLTTSFVTAATWTILKANGTARFRATHTVGPDAQSAVNSVIRLLKNNNEIATFTTSSSQTRQVDFAIAVNDVFVWEHRRSGGGAFPVNFVTIGSFALTATDGYTTTNLIIARSDL